MTQRTGAAALTASLAAHGVDLLWGIPGTHNLDIYAELEPAGIRHVLPRHEQGAAFAADGFARATGRVGVCLTTSGPGVLNAATALAQSWSDSIPVLLVSAGLPLRQPGRGNGYLHETKDLHGAMDGDRRLQPPGDERRRDPFGGRAGVRGDEQRQAAAGPPRGPRRRPAGKHRRRVGATGDRRRRGAGPPRAAGRGSPPGRGRASGDRRRRRLSRRREVTPRAGRVARRPGRDHLQRQGQPAVEPPALRRHRPAPAFGPRPGRRLRCRPRGRLRAGPGRSVGRPAGARGQARADRRRPGRSGGQRDTRRGGGRRRRGHARWAAGGADRPGRTGPGGARSRVARAGGARGPGRGRALAVGAGSDRRGPRRDRDPRRRQRDGLLLRRGRGRCPLTGRGRSCTRPATARSATACRPASAPSWAGPQIRSSC